MIFSPIHLDSLFSGSLVNSIYFYFFATYFSQALNKFTLHYINLLSQIDPFLDFENLTKLIKCWSVGSSIEICHCILWIRWYRSQSATNESFLEFLVEMVSFVCFGYIWLNKKLTNREKCQLLTRKSPECYKMAKIGKTTIELISWWGINELLRENMTKFITRSAEYWTKLFFLSLWWETSIINPLIGGPYKHHCFNVVFEPNS